MSQNIYLDRCKKPVEGLWSVICEDDDPEGGDGCQEGGADDGVTQGDRGGGHQVHGQLLISLPVRLMCFWSQDRMETQYQNLRVISIPQYGAVKVKSVFIPGLGIDCLTINNASSVP